MRSCLVQINFLLLAENIVNLIVLILLHVSSKISLIGEKTQREYIIAN